MPDILGAVYDFVLQHGRTGEIASLAPEHIIRGWQNYGGLPKGKQEFCVLTLQTVVRHGTNVWRREDDPESATGLVETISRLGEALVQADFCASAPNAPEHAPFARAQAIETLARDPFGVEFFRAWGLSSCYADDVRAIPYPNDQGQWSARYSTTLHLTYWFSLTVPQPGFTRVKPRIENVDVHHPQIANQQGE